MDTIPKHLIISLITTNGISLLVLLIISKLITQHIFIKMEPILNLLIQEKKSQEIIGALIKVYKVNKLVMSG